MPRKRKLKGALPPAKKCQVVKNQDETWTCASNNVDMTVQIKGNREHLDGIQLLNIFPAEVWELILKKVDDTDVLEKVSNSNLFLRRLLAPKQVYFLFPKVLEILRRARKNNSYFCPDNYHHRLRSDAIVEAKTDSFDFALSDYFGKKFKEYDLGAFKAALKLRLTCQSWNKSIDRIYVHRELRLPTSFLESFLPHFFKTHDSTGKSPFVGRTISIRISQGQSEHYINLVHSILDSYGQHFWHCSISVSRLSFISFYPRIQAVLQKMTNLKTLDISIESHPLGQKNCLTADEMECLASAPLPALVDLQDVQLYGGPIGITQQLLRASNHILRLVVKNPTMSSEFGIQATEPPKLTTFVIDNWSWMEFLTKSSLQGDWPLTILDMDFTEGPYVKPQSVFDLLQNKFRNTLTHLSLQLSKVNPKGKKVQSSKKLFQESKAFKLDLPRLTHLKIRMRSRICLDFLLPMKNSLLALDLESCSFLQGSLYNGVKNWCSKIQLSTNTPLESNIWTLFPNLDKLNFGCYTFTRTDWKMRNQMTCTLCLKITQPCSEVKFDFQVFLINHWSACRQRVK